MKNKTYYFGKVMLISLILSNFFSNFLIAQLADSPWPMLGHDERHSFCSHYKGPDSVRIAWIYELGENAICDPIIGSDRTLYIGTEHKLIAIDSTGSTKWEYSFPTTQWASPTPVLSADETVYIARRSGVWDRYLFAFSEQSGTVKWKYKIDDVSESSPVIGSDGTIFLGTGNGKFIALNKNGSLKWQYTTGFSQGVDGPPVLGDNNMVYFGHSSGRNISHNEWFYSLNLNDGSLEWNFDLSQGPFSYYPCIDLNGTIYCSGFYQLYAFNPDGSIKWLYPYDRTIVAIGPEGNVYSKYSDKLYAFNPESGGIKWEYSQSEAFGYPTVDSTGAIYIVSDSAISVINSNGELQWSKNLSSELSLSWWDGHLISYVYPRLIIGSKKDIYLACKDKLVAVFEPRPGTADLVISHFDIIPKFGTNVGAKVNIGATVKNIAGSSDAQCDVTFYVDGNPIGKSFVFISGGMEGHSAKVTWETQGYEAGEHSIYAYIDNVDPQETITTNNQSDTTYILHIPIQQQINNSTSGDTVFIEPGTYYENLTMKANITLFSNCGSDSTTIDGNNQGNAIDLPSWSDNMHIVGFTIINSDIGINMDSPYNSSVRNCRIFNNNKGIYIYGIRGKNLVSNNIIENNTIGIDGNNPRFDINNNTIVKNYDYGIKSIGANEPTPNIQNCILWGNGDDLGETAKADYSCIEDMDIGTGVIHDNPLFEDYDNGNYHLQLSSSCIDKGNPAEEFNDPEDPNNPGLALLPALGGLRNDIGAYGGPGAIDWGEPTAVKDKFSQTSNNIPENFDLLQNYPNPFNPETTIKYQLPEPSEVTIRIFNVTGQVVKIILDEHRPAGYHSVLWDGKDGLGNHVSSGVYFYQLRARSSKENFIETKKMILVR